MGNLALKRPSTAKAAEAKAKAKETHKAAPGAPVRVVLEVTDETRWALKNKAGDERKTVRDYLLGLAQADGVKVHALDLVP